MDRKGTCRTPFENPTYGGPSGRRQEPHRIYTTPAHNGAMIITTAQNDLEWSRAGADVYDEVITARFELYHRRLVEPYLDRLAASGVQRVLDVGCGTGVVALALARRGMDVVALDHSPYMLEIAERKAHERGLAERISFTLTDATMVPHDDESFDAVTCQRMLHHLQRPDDAVDEIVRLTRRGGAIYLCEPTTLQTPIKRLIVRTRKFRRTLGLHAEGSPQMRRAADEGPIDAEHLLSLLVQRRVEPDTLFLTQIGQHHRIPDAVRWGLIQAASWPWRHSRGDLAFVFATKKTASS